MSGGVFYVNANLASTSGDPAPLAKSLTFSMPLIPTQGDYVVGVSRLVLPLYDVPMWIPMLRIGGDGYETAYAITLTQGTGPARVSSGPTWLRLVQQNPRIPVPDSPIRSQPDTEWSFIYDTQQIADMLTTASASALTALSTAGGVVPAGAQIVWQWNAVTSMFSASFTPYSGFEQSAADPISIWFSASFFPYLAGWQVTQMNTSPSASEANGYLDVLLAVKNNGSNWLDAPSAPGSSWLSPPGLQASPFVPRDADTAVLTVSQHWPAPWVYNALATVQIIASGITNIPEVVQPQLSSGENSQVLSNSTSALLTDFAPDLSGAGFFEQTIVYNASSQIPGMRFIELLGGSALSNITLAAYWTDQHGRQRPLKSARESQSAIIKLCFAPRTLAGLDRKS